MDDGEDGGPRRIELASPKDFAHLIANVRAAAAEHLHAAFPPQSDGGEDELRNEIEAIVDDVCLFLPPSKPPHKFVFFSFVANLLFPRDV